MNPQNVGVIEFAFERYLVDLPLNLALSLCHFRCSNHKLPVEKGRLYNIERRLRTCDLCHLNVLGDEFHYIFVCAFFKNERKKYISSNSIIANTYNFRNIFQSIDNCELLKLSLFVKKIIDQFK